MDKKHTITLNIECLGMESLGKGYSTPPEKVKRTVEVDGKEVFIESMTSNAYFNKIGNPALYEMEEWAMKTERLFHNTKNRENRRPKRCNPLSYIERFFRKITG